MLDLNQSSIIIQDQGENSSFEVGVVVSQKSKLENLSLGVIFNYWTELVYLANEKIIKAI